MLLTLLSDLRGLFRRNAPSEALLLLIGHLSHITYPATVSLLPLRRTRRVFPFAFSSSFYLFFFSSLQLRRCRDTTPRTPLPAPMQSHSVALDRPVSTYSQRSWLCACSEKSFRSALSLHAGRKRLVAPLQGGRESGFRRSRAHRNTSLNPSRRTYES